MKTNKLRAVAHAAVLPFAPLFYLAPAVADETTFSERAWEEMVVVGSYLPRPAREVGSAVTVLDAEDIANRKQTLASELLREVPGLAVNRSGPVGALTQIRIRGAEGNHTLVLIDGIEVNDPALGSEFNFGDLLTHDIQRIEVLRGPQSALYGSDAIGGVIRIETPQAVEGFAAHGELEGGSFGTVQAGGSVAAGTDRVAAHLSAVRFDSDGISASAIEPEKDGYQTTAVHGKVVVELTDNLDARLVLRHSDNEAEADRQDFSFPPTPTEGLVVDADNHTESAQTYGLLELNARTLEGRWLHRAAFGYTDTESDAYSDGAHAGGNRGQREKYEYHSTLLLGDGPLRHSVTAGVQHERLDFRNVSSSLPAANQSQEDHQTSFIGEYALTHGNHVSASFSVRQDDNDRFENATTFRTTVSYLLESSGTRFHASYGEGITNPSFTELFGFFPDSFVGNPGLRPEHSESYDLGVEQALLGGRMLVDVTWFDATLEDEITTVFDFTDFTSSPINQNGESERQGVELTAQGRISELWSFSASYTYLDAEEPGGLDELRRPRHSGSANVNYAFLGGRGNFNVGAVFNGEQEDSEFVSGTPGSRVVLDDYTLLNVAVSFELTEQVELFARGVNLLDEDYTEVFSFRSPGAAGYLGVRARL